MGDSPIGDVLKVFRSSKGVSFSQFRGGNFTPERLDIYISLSLLSLPILPDHHSILTHLLTHNLI